MKKRRSNRVFLLSFTRKSLLLGLAACLLLCAALFAGARPQSVAVVSAMSGQVQDNLRPRIELLAKQYPPDPLAAKNDRVWKAIPGINGLKVDVEATLKEAEKTPGATTDRLPLVFKQIPPKVSLDNLGPLPIYRANPEKKQMALIINVAWGTEYIQDILSILDQNEVKATFFLDGSWTSKNPDVAKEILSRGHELGNHAYTHPDMAKLGAGRTLQEIARTNLAIQKATGITPKLFAPPSGSYTDLTVRTAQRQGMRTILWTLDTIDWKKPPASTIVNRILPRAENGAMVLMHPTEPTCAALRTLIPELKKKGYGLVTVSDLISPNRPLPHP